MNLRTLKKLSKRAAALLPLLGQDLKQFAAAPAESYHGEFIGERKHWDRHTIKADYSPFVTWNNRLGKSIVFTSRAGHRVLMRPPAHPRKGTIMVGYVNGGMEPEWVEECAWSALVQTVLDAHTDWSDPDSPTILRVLRKPSHILRAAEEMAALRNAA